MVGLDVSSLVGMDVDGGLLVGLDVSSLVGFDVGSLVGVDVDIPRGAPVAPTVISSSPTKTLLVRPDTGR